jgi:excisionase family DNA binding protein
MITTDQNPPAPVNLQEERYITKKEVASRLERDIRTVDNWMRQGKLPYYKIGRAVAFRWSEVQAFLSANFKVVRK